MSEMAARSLFFGAFLTVAAYLAGQQIRSRFGKAWLNPILISVIFIIAVLSFMDVGYQTFYQSAKYISYLLTPATICLAVPLYEQFQLLKKNLWAALGGIITGVLVSMVSVLILSRLFDFSHEQYITFLPKSITSAIGLEISNEYGGYASLTVAVIIITGILGNIIAEMVCRIFHITDPIAKGIAIGTSAHAIGAAKAMEMGKIEGAMSSLSIVTSGILTVILAIAFQYFA